MRTKTILLAGTKKHSIARVVGGVMHAAGWDVWLYSRSAKRVNRMRWHERSCDISEPRQVQRLVNEIGAIDAVVFAADPKGHGTIREISDAAVAGTVGAKLTGSVLLSKYVLKRTKKPVILIWLVGKIGIKPADLFLYGLINPAIRAFVQQLQATEKNVRGYLLPMGVVTPSTLGNQYVRSHPKHKFVTEKPETIASIVRNILLGGVPPGIVRKAQSRFV